MVFDYSYIESKIKTFPNVFSLGQSTEKREIYAFSVGYGKKYAVFAAAFHSLEYLTAPALISFAEKYINMPQYHNKLTAVFVPMVNPDGVEIVLHGLNPKSYLHKKIINSVGIIEYSSLWQSNVRGVDINHNFNADWQPICNDCSPTKYGGTYPFSESESRAFSSLLTQTRPELFIAFHSQGKEIYYDFNGMENSSAKENAEFIAKKCGYVAAKPNGTASFGGAKDWYIQEFHKQAFTIELGFGKNPLPIDELPQMEKDVYDISKGFIDLIF